MGLWGHLGVAAVAAGLSVGLVGAYLQLIREEAGQKRLELERVRFLRSGPTYWREVSLTRMGLYVSRIESRFIKKALAESAPSIVVDIGAGDGRLEPALLASSKAVIATDITRHDLEGMQRVSSLGLVHVGQYPSLPFLSGTVDVVVTIEVPAASEEEWFMAESARVLRPGGSVICSMYNRASCKKLLRKAEDRQYYRMSISEQRKRWAAAGFRLERAHGFYWLPFTRGSDSSLVPLLSLLEWPLRLGIFACFSPWTMEHFVKISSDGLATD